jgi:outer membrane protein assembly factor BamD
MKKYCSLFAVICALLAGCSTNTETAADQFKGQDAKQIFTQGEQYLVKKRYKDTIKNFEGLDALYPFSEYEESAQLQLIYAYYMDEDYSSSAATAERFIRLYPRSQYVDYAYFMKGMAHFETNRGFASKYFNLDLAQRDLTNAEQAFNDFSQLIQYFPNSPYNNNAKARMINLRNLMAQHEVEVATYYYQHMAYLAAANRAYYVVQHYQTSPAVVPALALMVQSYRALELNELANQTLAILAYNYPNSPLYKQLIKEKKVD